MALDAELAEAIAEDASSATSRRLCRSAAGACVGGATVVAMAWTLSGPRAAATMAILYLLAMAGGAWAASRRTGIETALESVSKKRLDSLRPKS